MVYERFISPLRNEIIKLVDFHPGLDGATAQLRLAEMASADLIVEQQFDFSSFSTECLSNEKKTRITFPYVAAPFYWPFGMQAHVRNQAHPLLSDGPYPGEIGDRYLNNLIRESVPAEEAVKRYLEMDIAKVGHVERNMEIHIDRQRKRDQLTGVQTVDFILDRFQDEKLFRTTGHPDLSLFRHIAEQVFAILNVPQCTIRNTLDSLRVTPFPSEEAPIHPGVSEKLGLKFADVCAEYQFWDEGKYTFSSFARRYMDYEWCPDLLEGISLQNGGKYDEAAKRLTIALRQCPGSAAGYKALGMALAGLGRFGEADQVIQKAISISPNDPEFIRSRATLFSRQGLSSKAVTVARAAIDIFPRDAKSHFVMADALWARGDINPSLRTARYALSLEPGDVGNITTMIANLMRAGEHAEATVLATHLVSRRPKDTSAYLLLAKIQRQTSDDDGAEATLRAALAVDSSCERTRDNLAELMVASGRYTEALNLLDMQLGVNARTSMMYLKLAKFLQESGELSAAETALGKAIQLDPANDVAEAMLSAILFRLGRKDECLTIVRRTVERGCADPHIHARFGHLLLALGDLQGAEAAMRSAICLDDRIEGFQHTLAIILEKLGKEDEATEIVMALAQRGSADPHLYARLGKLLSSRGDLETAEEAIKKAIELDPSISAFQASLEKILAEKRFRSSQLNTVTLST